MEAFDKGSLPTWLIWGVWRVGRSARKSKTDVEVPRDQEMCRGALGGGTMAYRRHRGAVVTTGLAHRSTPSLGLLAGNTGDGAHGTLSPQHSTQGVWDDQHGPSYRKLRPEGGK